MKWRPKNVLAKWCDKHCMFNDTRKPESMLIAQRQGRRMINAKNWQGQQLLQKQPAAIPAAASPDRNTQVVKLFQVIFYWIDPPFCFLHLSALWLAQNVNRYVYTKHFKVTESLSWLLPVHECLLGWQGNLVIKSI